MNPMTVTRVPEHLLPMSPVRTCFKVFRRRPRDFPRRPWSRAPWWITYLFDQALWVDPTDQTRSWGVFGNFGISDGKPNPIQWSGIFGIGGSSPIPDRKQDTFGLAYYYLGLSDDFKNVAQSSRRCRRARPGTLLQRGGDTVVSHHA